MSDHINNNKIKFLIDFDFDFSLQKCFEIKCILFKDYKACRKENSDNQEFKSKGIIFV